MRTKTYFASDFHLGTPSLEASAAREQRIIAWLDAIEPDAERLYLVGDIFDFWFEYKHVIPKGFLRLFAKLLELQTRGVAVEVFVGNHDFGLFDYLPTELGIPVHRAPIRVELRGKRFLIGHGDGLGPGDTGYKLLKKWFFHNRFCQWLFRWLHPDIGMGLANYFSRRSRAAQREPERFLGRDREWLLQYAHRKLEQDPQLDFFVFGHRHLPLDVLLDNGRSRYINLGEWLHSDTYAVWDGEQMELKKWG